MQPRLAILIAPLAALAVGAPAPAATSPLQEHPAGSHNVHLLGRVPLAAAPARLGAVAALGDVAYAAVSAGPSCGGAGIQAVSVADPSAPARLSFVRASAGTSIEGAIDAIRLDTPDFRGDVLIHGNVPCSTGGGGGFDVVDVRDPDAPVVLSAGAGDAGNADGSRSPTAHAVDAVAAWSAGEHAYVVALDADEARDVDLFDITDPRAPRLLSERGVSDLPALDAGSSPFGLGSAGDAFAAGVSVQSRGGHARLLVSAWDAGTLELGVDDPARPVLLARSHDPATDPLTGQAAEGNAAHAVFDRSGALVLSSDELVDGRRPVATVSSGPLAGTAIAAREFAFAEPLAEVPGARVQGPVTYGGYGCDAGTIPAATPPNAVLVLQRGPDQDPNRVQDGCRFDEKVANAAGKVYAAVLVADDHVGAGAGTRPDALACGAGRAQGIPALCISHRALHELFGHVAGYAVPYPVAPDGREPVPGERGPEVTLGAGFAGTGYAHLLAGEGLDELDVHALGDAFSAASARPGHPLAVLDVATDPDADVGYTAYATAGLRAVQLKPKGLKELGHYVPDDGAAFLSVRAHVNRSGARMLLVTDDGGALWLLRYRGS